VVIVGAGHAGVEAAAALRQKGFGGALDVVSDDTNTPYQRPPLSKEYIKRPGNALVLRPAQFYETQKIRLHTGVQAQTLDRAAKTVALSNGLALSYDHLVLATGARNRMLPVPGMDHPDVIELRSLSDADRIVKLIGGWRRVAVIGGGFIGLEAAGLFASMGIACDVVETAPRLMQRAVSPAVSAWFGDFHAAHGVRLHMPQQVRAVNHLRDGATVELTGGETIAADAVLLAAGVLPNTELAAGAGLAIGNGIIVDSLLTTSDASISAIGDCASYPNMHLGAALSRVESVQNATDQARTLAATLMGEAKAYDALPWFWSIQGEARLQIAGLSKPGLTEIVRGDPAKGAFSVFLFDQDKLQAVESINAPADHMVARRLIANRIAILPDAVADIAYDIRRLAAA